MAHLNLKNKMKKFATMIVCAFGVTLLGLNYMSANKDQSSEKPTPWFSTEKNIKAESQDYDVSKINLPSIFLAILQLAK